MKKQVISLILGGGAGSRLYPLTSGRSKPAVPIAGKYRLIDIPISNCLNSGLHRIAVLTQYNSASLNRHIKNTYHFDLFSRGFVDIFAAEQTLHSHDWFQGTADAVRQSIPRLENFDFDYVMVLSGDQLYQMDFAPFLDFHFKSGFDLTIATIPVTAKDATGFGIMKVTKDGNIQSFTEKPREDQLGPWPSELDEKYTSQGKHYLASMGIYLFNKSVLQELLAKNPGEHDFGKGIIPYAIENSYKVGSYPYGGYWTDIGTINSFFEANLALTDPVPEFNLFDNENVVYTRARMLSPTKIFGTICERALIAEGCIINAKEIYRSVIGVRSRIGRNTVIRNCYNMGQDFYQNLEEILLSGEIPMGIGEDCHIENAIIDRNVHIGNGVVIKGSPDLEDLEGKEFYIREGIVVIRKGVHIAAGTHIGAPL